MSSISRRIKLAVKILNGFVPMVQILSFAVFLSFLSPSFEIVKEFLGSLPNLCLCHTVIVRNSRVSDGTEKTWHFLALSLCYMFFFVFCYLVVFFIFFNVVMSVLCSMLLMFYNKRRFRFLLFLVSFVVYFLSVLNIFVDFKVFAHKAPLK